MTEKVTDCREELRERLSDEQYEVTCECGTEPPFQNEYWDCDDDGVYHCVVCDSPLFSSEHKFKSGTGWPSYWQPVEDSAVDTQEDRSAGMVRTEVICAECEAHLGHVFPDGPEPTGLRYCINSAALNLKRELQKT